MMVVMVGVAVVPVVVVVVGVAVAVVPLVVVVGLVGGWLWCWWLRVVPVVVPVVGRPQPWAEPYSNRSD